jgi:peptidoglycan/LPS O-acetylase OafA/YrhL
MKWLGNIFLISILLFIVSSIALIPYRGSNNIFLYCGYFMAGFCFAINEQTMKNIEKYKIIFGVITLLGIIGIFIGRYYIYWIPWVTLVALLGYGKKYLNTESKLLLYLNKAVFPIYILHQTILVIVGYYILKLIDYGIMPYLLIMVLTYLISILLYEIISRIKIAKIGFDIK